MEEKRSTLFGKPDDITIWVVTGVICNHVVYNIKNAVWCNDDDIDYGDYLGRVFGALGMISSSMMPLGMLVFGPLSDIIKIEWLLMGTGILIFIEGFFLIGNKVLVEAGKPVPKPEQQ